MIPLPNDPHGRYWVVSRANDPIAERNALVTLVSMQDDGRFDVLGTSFVIYCHENMAICVGAAHSFEEPKRRTLSRSGHQFFNVPRDFLPKGPVMLDAETIAAIVVRDGEPFVCKIVGYNSIENYDVAVFGLVEPEGRDVFKWRVALDLTVPRVGDEVAALVNRLEVDPLEPGAAKITQDLHLRHGVVTDVSWNVEPTNKLGGQSFIVRTTIPMNGGMSGSPLVGKASKGLPMTVWGVASSDRSDPNATVSFHNPGDSTASMLWPAMGLFLPVSEEGETSNGHKLLGELLKKGAFDNRSTAASVETRGTEEKIEILYTDARDRPPFRLRLTTPGHPVLSPSSD